ALIPPGVAALPCPRIGHTADYDTHVQVVHPWLRHFDEVVVGDHTEWATIAPMSPAPVSTFPKFVGAPDGLLAVPREPRDADVVFTGTVLHPFYPEKAELVRQLVDLDEAAVKIVSGHCWYPTYLTLLGRAKVTCSRMRRPGATPMRGLEALAMGCAL